MSSWERARYIPWDRVPTEKGSTTVFDLESTKERIFRELHREAILKEEEEEKHKAKTKHELNQMMDVSDASSSISIVPNDQETTSTTTTTTTRMNPSSSSSSTTKVIVPYSHTDLLRQAAFGATLGSVTGALFGFMDGMKSVGENTVLQKASNTAKLRYLVQGTSRSSLLFGGFFATYQSIKYGIRIGWNDPGDFTEIVVATPISISTFYWKPTYRPALPYAMMLIGMDCFSLYMRKTS